MERESVRIVCIDDDSEQNELIQLILSRRGYRVIPAVGGREGLAAVERVEPDLVLLDLEMPGMDGWEVYRQLKARERLKDIPVIIQTAKAQSIDRVLALHVAKVDDYITKPFSPHELISAVEKVLQSRGVLASGPSPGGQAAPATAPATESAAESAPDEWSVPQLIAALEAPTAERRGEAVVELSKRRREDDTLLRETPAQDAFWRNVFHIQKSLPAEDAVQRWGRMSEVALALTHATRDQNAALRALAAGRETPQVRRAAISALGHNRDEQALAIIIEATGDADGTIRRAAVEALGHVADEGGLDAVRAAMADSSIAVRLAAINALAAIGTEAAVEALQAALASDDREIRIDAAKTFARPESRVAAETATRVLLGVITDEKDGDVLYTIATSLADLGRPEAIPALQRLQAHDSAHVREGATRALITFEERPQPGAGTGAA